jgi:hypothetical protein
MVFSGCLQYFRKRSSHLFFESKKVGSFTIGNNPASVATIKIPAKTVAKIKIAKVAKEAIVPGKKQGG